MPLTDAATRYVGAYAALGDFSGVAAVADPGGVRIGTFGGARTQSTFLVGSVSKTFTAAAVELLVRDGTMKYSDPLTKYVPEYRYADRVTIAQLLAHSAGVPDFYAVPAFASVRQQYLSLTEIAKWLSAFPLDFTPGSKGSYSNSGYSLLALAIERASRQTYGSFLKHAIFGPMDLPATGTIENGTPATLAGSAADRAVIADGWLIGNGSVYSNAADMLHWLKIAQAGIAVNFADLPYPYGWGREKYGDATVLSQDGRIPGYSAAISIDPVTQREIVLLSDVQCAVVTQMNHDLRDISAGKVIALPTPRPSFIPDASALREIAGDYTIGTALTLNVREAAGSLTLANANDAISYALQPVAPDTFYFRPLYATLKFVRAANGAVTAIAWNGQFTIPRR